MESSSLLLRSNNRADVPFVYLGIQYYSVIKET
jgi:hypothetical protein